MKIKSEIELYNEAKIELDSAQGKFKEAKANYEEASIVVRIIQNKLYYLREKNE